MNVIKTEFSKLKYKLHCPICNKLIFSLVQIDAFNECNHLTFVFDDYDNRFIKDSNNLVLAFEDATKLEDEDEGLDFNVFFEDYLKTNQNQIGIYIFDPSALLPGGIWFGFIK